MLQLVCVASLLANVWIPLGFLNFCQEFMEPNGTSVSLVQESSLSVGSQGPSSPDLTLPSSDIAGVGEQNGLGEEEGEEALVEKQHGPWEPELQGLPLAFSLMHTWDMECAVHTTPFAKDVASDTERERDWETGLLMKTCWPRKIVASFSVNTLSHMTQEAHFK